jgi:uncharacterized protein DUF6644
MLIGNPLNSELAFPILECFHIVGFAIAIGSIALVDFRLLGFGLRLQNPADLIKETGLWVVIGLSTSIFAGLLLYSTDPDKYYLSWFFVVKMICLILAIVFNYTLHRKVILPGASQGKGILVACVSLALWVSVIAGGMLVSFYA